MKLYRPMLLVFTILLGAILAGSASAEPRSTSSYIRFEDQSSAVVQAATDNKRSVEDQMTNRENRIVTTSTWPATATRCRQRPLMFLWNGGPGSSSSLVHLLGFGPRRLQPDGKSVANHGTLLDETDLVFVDPVGTGYSRPTRQEYGNEFYQTRGDAESVAEFIRVYRNRFEAWEAPLFLAGESYGVIRAAGVADILQRRQIAAGISSPMRITPARRVSGGWPSARGWLAMELQPGTSAGSGRAGEFPMRRRVAASPGLAARLLLILG